MQTKFSFYLNEIFKFIVIFMLFFVWINYLYPNFLMSVVISLIASAITSFILSSLLYKKQLKTQNTSKERSAIKTSSMQFMFNTNEQNLDFFSQVFSTKNIKNQIKNNYLVLYPNTTNAVLVVLALNINSQLENHIIFAHNLCAAEKINRCLILTQKTTMQAQSFANSIANVSIVLQNETQIYNNYLKPTKMLPQNTVEFVKNTKQNFKDVFMLIINKRNTKHYFWSAFIMIFASLFIRLSTYYIVFSSVFLALSFLSFNSDFVFNNRNNFLNKIKQPKHKNIVKKINTN